MFAKYAVIILWSVWYNIGDCNPQYKKSETKLCDEKIASILEELLLEPNQVGEVLSLLISYKST